MILKKDLIKQYKNIYAENQMLFNVLKRLGIIYTKTLEYSTNSFDLYNTYIFKVPEMKSQLLFGGCIYNEYVSNKNNIK